MVEGGMKCVKLLLFAFNLIFVIAAIALIAVGAYVQIKLVDYYDFFGNEYTGPGILLIVVGVFIFLIAFFGCMGALKENYCLTMSFAVLLAVVFIMMIAGGIAAYVMRNSIEKEVTSILSDAQKNFNLPGHEGVTKTWNKLQHEFACCGVKNSTEWPALLNGTYPASCCIDDTTCDTAKAADMKQTPCEDAFVNWLKDKVAIIGGVGVGLAFIMIVGVLFACCLARAIRKEYEVV